MTRAKGGMLNDLYETTYMDRTRFNSLDPGQDERKIGLEMHGRMGGRVTCAMKSSPGTTVSMAWSVSRTVLLSSEFQEVRGERGR